MEERGKLKVGEYSILKEALEEGKMQSVLDIVKERGSEITQQMQRQDSTTIRNKRTRAGSDGPSSDKKSKSETQGTSTAGDDSPSNKKRKTGHSNVGKFSKEEYDRKGMQGFLLILNFTKNRHGTQYDDSKLKKFFGETLGFEVRDPRKDRQRDLTLSELDAELDNVRKLLNHSSTKYFCFFCAVLSHGNEKGILCGDKDETFKSIDDIWKSFTNDKIENFAGKPKVFLIQACRGKNVQRGHTVKDDVTEVPEDIKYVAEKTSVPTDADVLLAYATTPGYVAWRNVYSGTWFIQTTLDVFEEHHEQEHVEEMFIRVRNGIAKDPRFRAENDGRMMPCTWTTLTKMLMI